MADKKKTKKQTKKVVKKEQFYFSQYQVWASSLKEAKKKGTKKR